MMLLLLMRGKNKSCELRKNRKFRATKRNETLRITRCVHMKCLQALYKPISFSPPHLILTPIQYKMRGFFYVELRICYSGIVSL